MINLLCGQDLEKLGIRSLGTWNMLAFWDHLDACDPCREAKETLIEELNKLIGGEKGFQGRGRNVTGFK